MNDMSKAEAARAAREARDRVGSSRGSSASAIEAAMRQYLSAEQYHQLGEGAASTTKDDEKDDEKE